jgi:hypothetical protein
MTATAEAQQTAQCVTKPDVTIRLQGLCGHVNSCTQPSEVVWRAYVRKLGEQIAMGPHSISRHLPVCENSQEGIGGVISECPAIGREGCWARGTVWQDLRQHGACDPFCLIRRIASGVFQSVREPSEETIIIRWLPSLARLIHQGLPVGAGLARDHGSAWRVFAMA